MRWWFVRPPSVLVLLRREHAQLRRLLIALTASTSHDEQRSIARRFAHDLSLHMRLEELVFYSAFRTALEGRAEQLLYWEAKQEHHVIDVLLAELRSTDPRSTEYEARAGVLRELVESHMTHEERRLFPIARRELTRSHLAAMAERIDELREELERPSPHAGGVEAKPQQ
jgi:hemerythrin-like domain-containing protein